jgi:hypothetical protein
LPLRRRWRRRVARADDEDVVVSGEAQVHCVTRLPDEAAAPDLTPAAAADEL